MPGSIAHNLSDTSMVYATASKGWRSGGLINRAQVMTDFSIGYEEEELWSFEIGYKSILTMAVVSLM